MIRYTGETLYTVMNKDLRTLPGITNKKKWNEVKQTWRRVFSRRRRSRYTIMQRWLFQCTAMTAMNSRRERVNRPVMGWFMSATRLLDHTEVTDVLWRGLNYFSPLKELSLLHRSPLAFWRESRTLRIMQICTTCSATRRKEIRSASRR